MDLSSPNFSLADAKESAFLLRSKDLKDYVGPIDLDQIEKSFEKSFERFVGKDQQKESFEEFMSQCKNLDTIVMTAHPTFFKSMEESGLLAQLFTALAMAKDEDVKNLEAQVRDIQARHPYQTPTTDQEGERLYEALKNTVNPARMMQRAMVRVAQKHYPDEWKKGHYSPFNRAIWQKFDRDGRVIPVNIQLSETLRQRRMGLELIYIPQFKELLKQNLNDLQQRKLYEAIDKMEVTARIYEQKERKLDALDENNIDLKILQEIIDDLSATKTDRVTHPKVLSRALDSILKDVNVSDELFIEAKMINDDVLSNGLAFATPTHRVNADDVHKYLEVERRKSDKGDLRNRDQIQADDAHFDSTEEMILHAKDQVSGSFSDMLKKVPEDGKPVHEAMMIRRFVYDAIDSHTIEKIDIAEAHNAMTQRGLRLAAKQYGVSNITDIGLLHEDHLGIDNAYDIYSRLLRSKQYLNEINDTVPGTSKKRPRIVLKIGYSDFAKQHSGPGGKPYNEKCLLQTMKAIKEAPGNLASKIDLDIEFAGGEGPGRRVNLMGYEWTLKETVTPAVLAYAAKHGIKLKYRETIQGGDGCILLGTPESAAKIMSTQLDHISKNTAQNFAKILNQPYYKEDSKRIQEHLRTARDAYHALYNDPDFALLMKLYKEMCIKGGSRKLDRGDVRSPYEKPANDQPPLADIRAIGFNATSINTGIHLPPIYGQGTAFYESLERTQRIVKSPLFRQRLITAFMVRDLHYVDALKSFAELYNAEYWKNLSEDAIAERVEELVYSDDPARRVYPRLMRAIRVIEKDLEKFDKVRANFDFDDIENLIAQGDYKERLAEKRKIIKSLHDHRLELLREGFKEREKMPLHSPHYSRVARSNAIKAGAVLDFSEVSRVFDPARAPEEKLYADFFQEIIGYAVPLLDLAGNA